MLVSGMFPPVSGPRIFALPPGVDFIAELVAGIEARLEGAPPEAWAEVEIFLNTRRAARALETRLASGPARLLPRIRTVPDLASDPLLVPAGLPPAGDPLRRRLDLARLVRALLSRTGIAPETSAFGLADSLGHLLDELGGAGADPARLGKLDAAGHAEHWQRALAFLDIAASYAAAEGPATGDARLRAAVGLVAARWAVVPPRHPILIAGSTGSRAPMRELMRAVAALPQGAVILPGVDPYLPQEVWERLGPDAADHPQHGFRALGDILGFDPSALPQWTATPPARPQRDAVISLALRPAPVTDQWRAEAPAHVDELPAAIAGLTWMEAPTPRLEADAIALALREAAESGITAALITTDRTLARRVTARLARWSIIPDDSAGRPLALTPPGILLGLLTGISADGVPAETLLALLKHPLVSSAPGARGPHLRLTQALEMEALAGHPPIVQWQSLRNWSRGHEGAAPWIDWLETTLCGPAPDGALPLSDHVVHLRRMAEALAAGPENRSDHVLWARGTGEAADLLLRELATAARPDDLLRAEDFRALLAGLLHARSVPEEAVITHPGIAIWGTLEARSQWADRVILAGLNEGVWPQLPEPDPWLSRPLRRAAGLPPPESLIGLSAHDFIQAAAAPEVILSRAARDAEAPTVPSRWLLRIENLLRGMGEAGERALALAQARGEHWLALARRLDTPDQPVPAATRPSPVPPLAARPRRLSVTSIETLIRDPYSIYARHVLRLKPLLPPGREPDPLARGTALHKVMECFIDATADTLPDDAEAVFRAIAGEVLATTPWPAVREIWRARLTRIAPWYLAGEAERRARAAPFRREVSGKLDLPGLGFTLTGRADRIDRDPSGAYAIYDYKSGSLPSDRQLRAFHLQLPLEAAMIGAGGFPDVPPGPVFHLELIGLGGTGDSRTIAADGFETVLARLGDLLGHYLSPESGFSARLRPQRIIFEGDYDHLSRWGEWSDRDDPVPEVVG